jgi:hypothetical protein
MTPQLSQFQVFGLYGARDFDLRLTDNKLIIVGENGSGKTTLLRMIFYFLSGRWQSLIQFQFKSIGARIDQQDFTVSRDELVKAFRGIERRFFSKFPPSVRARIQNWIQRGQIDRIDEEVSRLADMYGIAPHVLEREIRNYLNEAPGLLEGSGAALKAMQSTMAKMQSTMEAQILYLPTYRRIERELSSIFEVAESDDLRRYKQRQRETDSSYIELVEFGMKDVQLAVNGAIGAIPRLCSRKPESVDTQIPERCCKSDVPQCRYAGDSVCSREFSEVDY